MNGVYITVKLRQAVAAATKHDRGVKAALHFARTGVLGSEVCAGDGDTDFEGGATSTAAGAAGVPSVMHDGFYCVPPPMAQTDIDDDDDDRANKKVAKEKGRKGEGGKHMARQGKERRMLLRPLTEYREVHSHPSSRRRACSCSVGVRVRLTQPLCKVELI